MNVQTKIATGILSAEHRVIEKALDALESMIAGLREHGRLDKDTAARFVDFFRNFADGCHHAKEEKELFRSLEAKGFSPDEGPVRVMLFEHDLGRDFVRKMESAALAHRAAHDAGARDFEEAARDYVTLLRSHIAKEDHCLFPMADQALTDGDQKKLLALFEKAEAERGGEKKHDFYVRLAEELSAGA
ncbi:MAG: hemerythrin domain-containing protein [Candidatus Omnitrophota bacterium]